jgi:hypothetical protein
MTKPTEPSKKFNLRAILIAVGAIVVLIVALMLVAQKVIENKLFDLITHQRGVTITIGSRHGSIFSGYTLNNVTVSQPAKDTQPATTITLPKLIINWKIASPPRLTRIAWDAGTYKLEPKTGAAEEVPLGAADLLPATSGDDLGWLVNNAPIIIGPDSWDGKAGMKIRCDAKDMKGTIKINQLPPRFLSIATSVPSDFLPFGNLILDMQIDGSPQNPRVSGIVTDPYTRQAFRF